MRQGCAYAAATLVAVCCVAPMASAAPTPAGTTINSVATATYEQPDGSEETITSNAVALRVDEILDVTVASSDPGDVATSASAIGQRLSFTLTNAGNGTESFTLSAQSSLGGDQFDPALTSILLDSNGNGAYDPGVDTVYVAGSNDPQLAANQSLAVFLLSSIPAGAGNGDRGRVALSATAKTASGTPGSSFAGLGQGGGDAVVGATGGDAEDDGFYAVTSATLSFVKSAAVADIFGGTTPVPGSTITYTLSATVNGSGSLANLRVADSIPPGTSFKADSIMLDGATLTDAADGDAGQYSGTGIAVGLGTLSAGTTRTIKFQVTID
jgi:uncharacterized repeat protein (TIGR01451 family)